jgi:hypothetical protein
MGTVRTTLLRPSSDACFQNDVPPRVEVTWGRWTGRKPHLKTGGTTLTPMLGSGRYVWRSRLRKS